MVDQEFRDFQDRIFEFYNQQKYRDALGVALEAATVFPEKRDRTSFWIACLQSRLGEFDEAVQTLRQGLQEDVWWSENWLLGDSDLLPLHNREDFRAVLAECERRRCQAQVNSKPNLSVQTPPRYSGDRAWPLMIALHGRGINDVDSARDWKTALTKGVVLAVPRSSQLMSSRAFGWDDLAKSEQEMAAAYSSIKNSKSIDAERVILAGYSQGAALAIYLALKKTVPSVGFIAVAPSLSVSPQGGEEWPNLIRSGSGKGLRGWLSIGDQDPRFQSQRTLHTEMVNRGLQCQLVVGENVGHEYPRDFESKLASAIEFILG